MGISIGPNAGYAPANLLGDTTKTDKITASLSNSNTSDKELMDACKSFESYLLEQVFKGMEKTVMKDESEKQNDYLAQFGDIQYEKYAEQASASGEIGIAQMLYDSIKRNS